MGAIAITLRILSHILADPCGSRDSHRWSEDLAFTSSRVCHCMLLG